VCRASRRHSDSLRTRPTPARVHVLGITTYVILPFSYQNKKHKHIRTTMEDKNWSPKPSLFKIWWTAARPHTLTASICPCIVSYASCRPPLHWQLAWTLFCATIQLGTNLHNDYADFCRGADTSERLGHARATARGWLTPQQTCSAATAVLSVTFASGVYLLREASQLDNGLLWFAILTSIFNAFAYTGGPYPLGFLGLGEFSLAYTGLADVFVFLYFGLVATWMLPYLQSIHHRPVDWICQAIYGSQVGLLATTILIVNNMRDRSTDVKAKKMTTAVRFGRRFSLYQYKFCIRIAYALIIIDYIRSGRSRIRLLPLASYPLAKIEIKAVSAKDGSALNPHVGGAAKTQLLFCLLLALGLALSETIE
jgi:1,4-dihydroxy-2-naphthoate polyprenyltransferase